MSAKTSQVLPENSVHIEGWVFFDPRINSASSGAVCNLVVDVSTGRGKSTRVNVVAWEADIGVLPKVVKGSYVIARGRLQSRTYQHKTRGKVEITEVVSHELRVVAHKIREQAPADTGSDSEDDDAPF